MKGKYSREIIGKKGKKGNDKEMIEKEQGNNVNSREIMEIIGKT